MKVLTTLAIAAAATAAAAPALAAHCSCAPRPAVHRHYIAPVRAHHVRYVAPRHRTVVHTRTVYVTRYINAPVAYDEGPPPPPVYERERVGYDEGPGRPCRHPHRHHMRADYDGPHGDRAWTDERPGEGYAYRY